MTGGGVLAPLAGIVIRPPPEGVGGDVAGGQLPADLLQNPPGVPGQLAQPLGGDQRLAGDGPGLVHLHGQETDARLPRLLHGGEHLRLVQHDAAPPQLGVHLSPALGLAHGPAARDHRVPGGQVEHAGRDDLPVVKRFPLSLQGEHVEQHLKAHAVPDRAARRAPSRPPGPRSRRC